MRSKTVIYVFCSLISALLTLAQSNDSPGRISLTIDRLGWSEINEEDDPIKIWCTFRNNTTEPLSVLLAGHIGDRGPLIPYLLGMSAKVTDKDQKVLTHTSDFGDWWSSTVLVSQQYRENPGDRVTLQPGEQVAREVSLRAVLVGLNTLEDGLKDGEYTVELRIGDITSNPLRLTIVAKD